MFSLVNKGEKSIKEMCCNEGEQAIYCGPSYKPCFGGKGNLIQDICITSDSNINNRSFSDFGYSFKNPDYAKNSNKAKNIYSGEQFFGTVEIEDIKKLN